MAEYMIANQTFHAAGDGLVRTVYAGQALPSTDPLVRANPDKFQTAEQLGSVVVVEHRAEVVEQATAAPGEKRTTPRVSR